MARPAAFAAAFAEAFLAGEGFGLTEPFRTGLFPDRFGSVICSSTLLVTC